MLYPTELRADSTRKNLPGKPHFGRNLEAIFKRGISERGRDYKESRKILPIHCLRPDTLAEIGHGSSMSVDLNTDEVRLLDAGKIFF